MTEDQKAMLAFIRGEGRWSHLGGALHTYPEGDENKKNIYEICLKLEKEGLIYRFIDEPDHVCWKPVNKDKKGVQ